MADPLPGKQHLSKPQHEFQLQRRARKYAYRFWDYNSHERLPIPRRVYEWHRAVRVVNAIFQSQDAYTANAYAYQAYLYAYDAYVFGYGSYGTFVFS